jgi:hypothetical protein
MYLRNTLSNIFCLRDGLAWFNQIRFLNQSRGRTIFGDSSTVFTAAATDGKKTCTDGDDANYFKPGELKENWFFHEANLVKTVGIFNHRNGTYV